MTRRAMKKGLRKAEDAFHAQNYTEAEIIYRSLLERFARSQPSLLDHVACIYGLIQTLHWKGEAESAVALAEHARDLLAARRELQLAA